MNQPKSFNHENQVGGNHYNQGDKPQHWDLVTMYEWDYFQAQITKYVMRWKDKHATHEKRLEDLRKARSFLDKYIENAEVYDKRAHPKDEQPSVIGGTPALPKEILDHLKNASALKSIGAIQPPLNLTEWFTEEGYLTDGRTLYTCKKCKAQGWMTVEGAIAHANSHIPERC